MQGKQEHGPLRRAYVLSVVVCNTTNSYSSYIYIYIWIHMHIDICIGKVHSQSRARRAVLRCKHVHFSRVNSTSARRPAVPRQRAAPGGWRGLRKPSARGFSLHTPSSLRSLRYPTPILRFARSLYPSVQPVPKVPPHDYA